ncbi:hypothetical protein G6F70_008019 [Rhizopus microsporus]|nr:hypothetical protein G6F71_007996 [Rhizopus microsporus]KAG1195722.1 hypothetical protein G6F70_008019 [Rhizopus microsporus]KAG1211129.1 hypothetical protein G6F69_004872 [Rhizopus microsporus]KAG1229092.1 hypothetical protein G6F67_007392 [Rhizopus microsporus]KAG1262687.1 hypothetical protein G6F68_005733 [Rhizopus microsporus]
MLYRIQIRTLCRPVLKAPDLVGFLPPSPITTSIAAISTLLKYKISVLLLAKLREPGMEALGYNVDICVLINCAVNQDQRTKTIGMKAVPNRHSTTSILLRWYNMLSAILFTNLSDSSGATIVTGNGEPRFIAPNDARSLFIRSVDMPLGLEKHFLHVLFCQ